MPKAKFLGNSPLNLVFLFCHRDVINGQPKFQEYFIYRRYVSIIKTELYLTSIEQRKERCYALTPLY